MIDIPKMPPIPEIDVGEIGPHPAVETNEELKKLNQTMERVLEQLVRIQGRLVTIAENTRPSGFK